MKTFISLHAVSVVVSLLFVTPAFALALSIPVRADQGKVVFHAVGRPSMIKVNGEGKGPAGTLTVTSGGASPSVEGDLTFDMTSLTSGISMRDSHMKEKYLETAKYPEAKLHLTEVSLPTNWVPGKDAKDRTFKGDLTLHGQTKPVAGTFDVSGPADALTTAARFTVDIAQFGVESPKYLGITIRNDVPIELTMNNLKATASAAK